MAIDVCSRCLLGMVVTLEAPSAVSVGLCLAHVCCDKRPWLDGLGVDVEWPMSGKPLQLYLDNAAEFKSEALRRGCEQHGIELSYRPPGQPHYGGIVERVIGTAMGKVHELPGTTFCNAAERGIPVPANAAASSSASWHETPGRRVSAGTGILALIVRVVGPPPLDRVDALAS